MNKLGIKKWLLDLEVQEGMKITHNMIANEAGVKRSTVTHTINGVRKNNLVLKTLIFYGCPKSLLFDGSERKAA